MFRNRERDAQCFLLVIVSCTWTLSLTLTSSSVTDPIEYNSTDFAWLIKDGKRNANATNGIAANSSYQMTWSSLTEYCTEFNITIQHCKCPTCSNSSESTLLDYLPIKICLLFNKTTKDCNLPKPTPKSNQSVDITTLSLEEVCQIFGIKTEDCVCPSRMLSQICNIVKTKQQNRQTIINCDSFAVTRAIIMVTIITFSIIGNLLVMAVTKHRWRTSPTSSKLVGALALSDFLFSVFTFTNEIHSLWTCKWIHGLFMCKFLRPAMNMTATMALGFILIISIEIIISIERFFGIVYPFNQIMSTTKVHVMSLTNVLVSLIVVIPAAIVLDTNGVECKEVWPNDSYSLMYSWFLFVVTFFLPIVFITIFYIRMMLNIKASQTISMKTFNATQQRQRKQEDNRITIILACLLISFIVLVLPNRIYWILEDHKVLIKFSYVPYLLHAAINPLIYSIVDQRFRASLKTIFLPKCLNKISTKNKSCSTYTSNTIELETGNIHNN